MIPSKTVLLEDIPNLAASYPVNEWQGLVIKGSKKSPQTLDEEDLQLETEEFERLSTALTSVLETCRGTLRKFSWSWTWGKFQDIVVPSHVWESLARAQHLEELDLIIRQQDMMTWVRL